MVTQQQIAKKLNISRTTVSRALAGSANIHPETKEKILSLCKSLGYRKNILSSSLATKKPKKVYVFIVKSINENYSLEMHTGIEKAKEELKNYNIDINTIETSINHPELQLAELNKIIKNEKPDGIIIIPQLKEQIQEIINNNQQIKFISLDIGITKGISHIGSDYIKSGKISANILSPILRDNEKILILDTQSDEISSKQYLKGFVSEAQSQNLAIVGPIYFDNILANIDTIINEYLTKDIKAIYSSRYLAEILTQIKNKKPEIKLYATSNGMSSSIHNLIATDDIVATVKENHAEQSYLATKQIFSLLYNTEDINNEKLFVKPEIIFKQNLS